MKLLTRLKKVVYGESGSATVEYLVKVVVIGLGSATVLLGILIAYRFQGGVIIDTIRSINF